MKSLVILIIAFSFAATSQALAKCPQLTGSYSCDVTDNKGNLLRTYSMSISQTKDKANTQYHITFSDGDYLQLVTDNTPRIKDKEENGIFKRRRLVASCTREILMLDEESYVSNDKHFSDLISYYDGSSSYFSNGTGIIGLHDGVLNYIEDGQKKQKAVIERDSCQPL